MSDRPVFLYAAIYGDLADAEVDYEAVFELHAAGAIGTFDSAVIRRDDDGKVQVTKTEKPTQHGAWTGAGVGALVGIIGIGSAEQGPRAGGAFFEQLRSFGYVEGRNLQVEARWANGDLSRLADLANDLVQRKVDIIVAMTTYDVRAAKKATSAAWGRCSRSSSCRTAPQRSRPRSSQPR